MSKFMRRAVPPGMLQMRSPIPFRQLRGPDLSVSAWPRRAVGPPLPIVILWNLGRNELVAQSVEQRTFNAWVVGSIPTELTTFQSYLSSRLARLNARHAPYR